MGNDSSKKIIIFDIDETLIKAYDNDPGGKRDILNFHGKKFFIKKRPGCDLLLKTCLKKYNIGIWSNGDSEYVSIVDLLFEGKEKPVFVYTRDNSINIRNVLTKQLELIDRKIEDLLIIDDNFNVINNFNNAIIIPKFNGDERDNILIELNNWINKLPSNPKFNKIIKPDFRYK